MVLEIAVPMLTLYFALFLAVSGLAKVDQPYVEVGGPGILMRLRRFFFSSITGRLLGIVEMVLAFMLMSGTRAELTTILNAILFGLFLLSKLLLILTKQGSKCGCFGAYELNAIDKASVTASGLILALAVILAALVHKSSVNDMQQAAMAPFLMTFGWLVLKVLRRRRLEASIGQQAAI